MPAVNPKILLWARETAGLTPKDAVARIGIKDARGEAAIDRLAALERGEVEPTRMLPRRMLSQIEIGHDVTEQQRHISEFVRARNLSRTMVAYRLLRAKRIGQQAYDALREVFRERWLHKRDRQRARAHESDGGPNYYVVRRHRVGDALLRITSRMVESDALSITKAAIFLDVKPVQVDKMLRHASATAACSTYLTPASSTGQAYRLYLKAGGSCAEPLGANATTANRKAIVVIERWRRLGAIEVGSNRGPVMFRQSRWGIARFPISHPGISIRPVQGRVHIRLGHAQTAYKGSAQVGFPKQK